MDRSDFGAFGARLTEGEFAQAVLAWVLHAHGAPEPAQDPAEVQLTLEASAADGFCEVQASLLPPAPGTPDAALYLDGWQRFRASLQAPLRLEVHGADSKPEAAQWLCALARHPEVDAASVYLRMDEPAWPVAWQWPLRLGVQGLAAPSRREAALLERLQQVWHRNLWRVVDTEQPGTECELLLLPGDLRQALAEVLAAPQRPRADAVLVLGPANVSRGRAQALLAALRRESRSAGVALLDPGNAPLDELLGHVVEELAHDGTLDVALFAAARRHGLAPPELVFSRALAAYSSVRLTAARVALQRSARPKHLQPPAMPGGDVALAEPAAGAMPPTPTAAAAPPVLDDQSRYLERMVESGGWHQESAEASELVGVVADAAAPDMPVARMAAAGAQPPQPTADEDPRQVLAQVSEADGDVPLDTLRADAGYTLQVRIGLPREGFRASGTSFPSHELRPSPDGHRLDVSFVPLTPQISGAHAQPQQQQVFLPATGDSGTARFTFSTRDLAGPFRSRILVSFENRVVQTLRLDAGETDATPYRFAVENLVQPGFRNLAYQRPFDAALVVNHDEQGEAGVTLLAGSSVSFAEPAGLAKMLHKLQARLTDETALRRTGASFEDASLTDLLYALMLHGRLLYDQVQPQLGPMEASGRIQLVEARPGAFFPLEFLYPLPVPPHKPPMCPNALRVLMKEPDAAHERCAHRDDPQHMCPLRFWGFRKEIERQASGAPREGQAITLSVPQPLQDRLDLFGCAQVARSANVQKPDFDPPKGVLPVLRQVFRQLGTPESWQAWAAGVHELSPGFLLLLSHSTEDAIAELPALEISNDVLPIGSLEADYVKGPAARAPVVFLLGCSTADPELGVWSYVERFKLKQAALVVGTLSTISAQRATRFLELALPIFKQAEGSGRSFGEVLLEVKRAALGAGDGFALSLVAYGDTGWKL